MCVCAFAHVCVCAGRLMNAEQVSRQAGYLLI